jgi:hypothetical protein
MDSKLPVTITPDLDAPLYQTMNEETEMPLTKLDHGTWTLLLCVFALLAASQPAHADTTILVCRLDTNIERMFVDEGPTTIELNEAGSTVTVHFAAKHPAPNSGILSGGYTAAYTVGPLHATFGPDTVTFQSEDGSLIFTINRVTGQLNARQPGDLPPGEQWNCQVGKRQF